MGHKPTAREKAAEVKALAGKGLAAADRLATWSTVGIATIRPVSPALASKTSLALEGPARLRRADWTRMYGRDVIRLFARAVYLPRRVPSQQGLCRKYRLRLALLRPL
jgi:hypothetical protein